MCFGDVATAPLAMVLPRTRTTHLKCAQSCWGSCTHKQAQTGRDMCWHRGMHAHPGFTFAHLCTCSHIHMAWGEFKCMCVHAHTAGFAPPETLTGLLQATILGMGRSCMGCLAAATPSRGFSSSDGALPSSNPSHCSTVACHKQAGKGLATTSSWQSASPDKCWQAPSLQSHAGEPCLPLSARAQQELSSLVFLGMLPASARTLRNRAGQNPLSVTAPVTPGIFHGVISHRHFPPSFTCL